MSTATPIGVDIALAPGDFERVRRMIKDRAGIHLQPSKQSMVQGRLARLLREHGLPTYAALLDAVDKRDSPLWQLPHAASKSARPARTASGSCGAGVGAGRSAPELPAAAGVAV
ncbi:MAG: hypothetical protein ACOYLX_17555, partial [Burkholderiaceae bacterium]